MSGWPPPPPPPLPRSRPAPTRAGKAGGAGGAGRGAAGGGAGGVGGGRGGSRPPAAPFGGPTSPRGPVGRGGSGAGSSNGARAPGATALSPPRSAAGGGYTSPSRNAGGAGGASAPAAGYALPARSVSPRGGETYVSRATPTRADAIPIRRAEVASAVFRVLGDPLDTEEERRKQVIEARAFALPTSPAAQSALASTLGFASRDELIRFHAEHKPATRTISGAPPKRSGWLTKQGAKRKNWKRRWFSLEGNKLSYYGAPEDQESIGEIELTDCCSVGQPAGTKPFAIELSTPTRSWRFLAENDLDKNEWIEVMRNAIRWRPAFITS